MALDFRLQLGAWADDLIKDEPRRAESPEIVEARPDPREILRAFGRAANREPGEPDYDFLLGCTLLRAGDPGRAVARCTDAVRLDRSNPEYHSALGCALWQLGRVEEAEAAFREAVLLRPGDAEARTAWGASLTRVGRTTEAAEELRTATEAAPRSAEAHGNLGAALWALGRRDEALRAFRRAAQIPTDRPDSFRNLGLALLEVGQPDRAVEALRSAAALSPDSAAAYLELAEAAHAAGRNAEAQEALDRATSLDPSAIASRPLSLAARDALRLERLRAEGSDAPRQSPDLGSAALGALVDAGAALGDLRPRGRAAGPVLLAAVLAVALVAARLLPPMVDHYLLRDAVTVVARAPIDDDANVRDRLAHAIREHGMESVLEAERCDIQTRPAWRRITCAYSVPRKILPGWSHTLAFRIDVEQPYVAGPEGRR